MKAKWLKIIVLSNVFLSCSLVLETFEVKISFPELPPAWMETLGQPEWSLVWFDAGGNLQTKSHLSSPISIEIAPYRSSPVLAYPSWPHFPLATGLFKPAGAIYPFAYDDDSLTLSWRGGIASYYFIALARFGGDSRTAPEYFDWPRFLCLLDSPSLSPGVTENPWLVDWDTVAQKTRASGFDSRRLVSRPTSPLRISLPAEGPWFSSSPFVAGHLWEAHSWQELEGHREGDIFACPSGSLRYSDSEYAWFPRL